jgi:hypothetical protein
MKVSEMTLEKFDAILPSLKFELLTYPERYAYEGAGPRCLIAEYDRPNVDGITVLFENGVYTVIGYDETVDDFNDEIWNVNFDAETGEREVILGE